MDDRWLVVGLGNPGPGYAGNRHNVGQMVLGELVRRSGTALRRHKTNSLTAAWRRPGSALVLAQPLSFMNLSGGPVAGLLRFHKVPLERLIVIHDELDIPFDRIRLKQGGGHGGHNGLRDIMAAAGAGDFIRVRVGIGRPPGRQDPADFVLRDFNAAERAALPTILADAADAVEQIVDDGITAAQLRFHTTSE